ncbi:MAG TPA: type III secretion system export apparatus subunit SctS [Polyangiaceae bacterium]|nr:type III secretion system export apparatus subunit SctS [Polyangiaceae bacterium]
MTPSLQHALASAQEALLLSVVISLPALAVAALVGLLVAIVQAATQVQDQTIAHLPRLVAVVGALALLGPWMGRQLAAFAARMLAGG